MLGLILRRLLLAIPILFIVTALAFALTALAPGDPARTILGPTATDEQYQELREQLHLNEPVWLQYGRWLGQLLHGNLGVSLLNGQPIVQAINQRLPITLTLVVASVILAVVIGLLLGIISALRGGILGRVLDVLSALGIAVPQYWLALLLVAVFAVGLRLFPATGWIPFSQSPSGWFAGLVLPTLALAAGGITGIAKQMRDSMVTVMQSDFILSLRAVGIARSKIVYQHALRNASIPTLTVMGLIFVGTVGGTVLVERVFNLPGMGAFTVTSTLNSDIPAIQGLVVYYTVIVLLTNLLIDIAYGVINPKVRVS